MARVVVWIVMLVGGGAVSYWLDWRWFRGLLLSPYFHILSFPVGIVLLVLVMRAARNTGRLLSRLGREGNVRRLETNRLVTTGYYACMRHPMHFGLLFLPLALAFLLGSPTFILLVAPLEMVFMIGMIKSVEEAQAVGKFGNGYIEYRRQVPFFSLRPSCLKALFGKGDPPSPA